MESLLTLWEHRINDNSIHVYETCVRCRKRRILLDFYDDYKKRRLCKMCRDYNKKYCKKYFLENKIR
jgi:hypothetical protein